MKKDNSKDLEQTVEAGEETPAPLTEYLSRPKLTLVFVECSHLQTEDLLHRIVASVD